MKSFLLIILLFPIIVLGQNHILITEIVVTPTAGEFVEIYNNTGSTIDLTDYYLTDATYAGGSTYYYNIVTGTNAGGGSFSDFHARFPTGSSIAANEFQTIAVDGAGFVSTYAIQPNYELNGTASNIPDMLEAFAGSINSQGGITNSGEVMVLYYWDGQTDLVQDIDYVVWGDKNEAIDKSGVSIDGPDPDSTPSSYLNDVAIASQVSVSSADPHSSGESIQRLDLVEHGETQSGGNGITGNDEMSEDLATSFPTGTPNPGTGPSNSPVISNIVQLPATPTQTDTVFITADITDNGTIVSVKLFTSIDSAPFDSTNMTLQSGDTYEANILPQLDSTQVQYYIKAKDDDGLISASSTLNYIVLPGGPPEISNIIQFPFTPDSTDTVTTSADVTDNGTIISVKLFTSIDSAPFDSTNMLLLSGDTYEANILPQPDSTQVQYYIKAKDDEGLISTSATFSYSVSTRGIFNLRVATYNILNYNGSDRSSYLTTVTQSIDADIIIVQEMLSQNGVDAFNSTVLNNQYSTIMFHDGYDTDNHLFYRTDKLQFISDNYLSTALRDIAEYQMRVLSNNEIIYFYSAHLKASSGSTNELLRLAEATILRNYLNNHPAMTNFIFVGDLNLYYSVEPAYHKLIDTEPDNDGRLFDIVDSTGSWHNNSNYASIHTQSPRLEQFGGGASGGLDDRFDFILVSNSMLDNIISSSYTEYGNDGQHFNQSINNGTNGAVSSNIADALYYASDHLPVYCDFVFESANGVPESETEKPESFIFFQNYPNPFNPLTTIKYRLTQGEHITLEVYNVLGQKIETLVNAWQGVGNHEAQFNAYELPSGVYFYRIQTVDFIQVKKMMLMK
jgi:endonuclease/exonuclease/phosphatase family metal-dependent hydrolase